MSQSMHGSEDVLALGGLVEVLHALARRPRVLLQVEVPTRRHTLRTQGHTKREKGISLLGSFGPVDI
jgi:hypothetical protein